MHKNQAKVDSPIPPFRVLIRAAPMAATFALIGWYLLAPPVVQTNGKLRPDFNAPLSEWIHVDSYDSAEACRQGTADHVRIIQHSIFQGSAADRFAAIWEFQLAECFATDDPRLKAN